MLRNLASWDTHVQFSFYAADFLCENTRFLGYTHIENSVNLGGISWLAFSARQARLQMGVFIFANFNIIAGNGIDSKRFPLDK